MFIRALARTTRTLLSPAFVGLLLKSMLIALVAYSLFVLVVGFGLRHFDFFPDQWEAELAADIGLTLGVGILSYLLLPIMLPLVAAFFQEQIANRIEGETYPEYMPPSFKPKFMEELWEDAKFVLLVIVLNLLLFWTYFFFPLTYYLLNGYLIGREFFETAAARHIGKQQAKRLRKAHRLPTILAGMLIVFLTNVPLVQLIAPFVGVAIMVHLYHLMPKKTEFLPPVQDAAKTIT